MMHGNSNIKFHGFVKLDWHRIAYTGELLVWLRCIR